MLQKQDGRDFVLDQRGHCAPFSRVGTFELQVSSGVAFHVVFG